MWGTCKTGGRGEDKEQGQRRETRGRRKRGGRRERSGGQERKEEGEEPPGHVKLHRPRAMEKPWGDPGRVPACPSGASTSSIILQQ